MNKSAVIILNYEDNTSVINTLKAFKELDLSIFLVGLNEIKSPIDNVTYLSNPNIYTPIGINLGIQKCNQYKNILICGARSIPSSNYITHSLDVLDKNPNIGCIGGRIIHTAKTETGKAIAYAMGAPLGMGIFSFRSLQKSGYTDTVSVPVFRKEVIEKVGLFDETLIRNQDDDYSYRIIKAGFKIWHETSISSTYYVREKYGQLFGQFFQYGFWKNYVNKKHKTITTIRQLAPPIFVITQIILLFINPTNLVLLLSIYLILIGIQSIALSHFKLITSIKTLYAFIVMHYSYGLGYLSGFMYAFIFNKQPPEFVKKITR
jgi:GT2 family glycosyltransferase